MWCKIIYFLPIIICISVQGICAEKYVLEYHRYQNKITLRCKNTSMTTKNVSFWINTTDKIDIQNINSASKLFSNTIQFVLTPQYEGTFYCGERDGEKSEGLGPIAANPKYVSSNYFGRHVWKKSGDVTLTCPIMVGALRQAYHVQWDIKQKNPRYTIEITDHYTSLTITNIKSEDYRSYVCSVSVINPIDKQHWVHFQRVYLSKDSYLIEKKNTVYGIYAMLIVISIISALCKILEQCCKIRND